MISQIEKDFRKRIITDFTKTHDNLWIKESKNKSNERCNSISKHYMFVCPEKKNPVDVWKKFFPIDYKNELDNFFDEVHPY